MTMKQAYLLTWQQPATGNTTKALAKGFDTMHEAASYLQAIFSEHQEVVSITLIRRGK